MRDELLAFCGALAPLICIAGSPQPAADLLQIFFGLVQQTIQADRGIMMCRRSVSSKARTHIKARLAHRTVALVVVGAELELMRIVASRSRHNRSRIAHLQSVGSPCDWLTPCRTSFDQVIVGFNSMKEEVS